MNRLVTMTTSVSALDRELNGWSKLSSHATPDLVARQESTALVATQTSTHTRAVAVTVKMVTAYNW